MPKLLPGRVPLWDELGNEVYLDRQSRPLTKTGSGQLRVLLFQIGRWQAVGGMAVYNDFPIDGHQ